MKLNCRLKSTINKFELRCTYFYCFQNITRQKCKCETMLPSAGLFCRNINLKVITSTFAFFLNSNDSKRLNVFLPN